MALPEDDPATASAEAVAEAPLVEAPADTVAGEVVLRLTDVVKTFPGVRALDGVQLEVRAGEVHCLLGQNGAGKSTLIKVLAGVHHPDSGAGASGAASRPRSPTRRPR